MAATVEERKIANFARHKNLPVLRGYLELTAVTTATAGDPQCRGEERIRVLAVGVHA
jgi:hypothetical protein